MLKFTTSCRYLTFQIYIVVSKDIDAEDESVLTRMLQAVAVPVLGNVCHVFMHGLNRVQVRTILSFFNYKVALTKNDLISHALCRYLVQKNCNRWHYIGQRTSA